MKRLLPITIAAALYIAAVSCGNSAPQVPAADGRSPQEVLFDDGNYAMFIHFGLYSKLEGEWKGKLYFGNAEWIMNEAQAGIPVEDYMAEAATFNPSEFDAKAIVDLAKAAGMRYIVITSKHHEGFAMFDSDACPFNVCDATPLGRDLMKELADACHEAGLGIGFYYSQFQDWTAPGGGRGPRTDASGREVSFDEYFRAKCVPQVEELTTKYGEIQLIWFDTPGDMSIEYSRQLVDIVRKNQPHALVSSRVGNGMGDYETLGDMQVPVVNRPGRWEGIDVVQVGWGFSKFDSEWKTPDYIVRALVSTIARGGIFMFNIGPDSKGRIPEPAQMTLRKSGEWVHRYPQVVYGTGASPWGHALPWGDAVTSGNKIHLVVFDWPADGRLWLPGVRSAVKSASIVGGKRLRVRQDGSWACISLPSVSPDDIASVIELSFDGKPEIDDKVQGILPQKLPSTLEAALGVPENCQVKGSGWMVKFGEWKFKTEAEGLGAESSLSWNIDVKESGYYEVGVEFLGNGLVDFAVSTDEGKTIVDRKKAVSDYSWQNLGWIGFDRPGHHTITLKVTDADYNSLKIAALRLGKVNL